MSASPYLGVEILPLQLFVSPPPAYVSANHLGKIYVPKPMVTRHIIPQNLTKPCNLCTQLVIIRKLYLQARRRLVKSLNAIMDHLGRNVHSLLGADILVSAEDGDDVQGVAASLECV